MELAGTESGCRARRSAAALAPAKLGIRPSAPGKRETPSRSIARQISCRTSSLVRMGADRNERLRRQRDEARPPRATIAADGGAGTHEPPARDGGGWRSIGAQ